MNTVLYVNTQPMSKILFIFGDDNLTILKNTNSMTEASIVSCSYFESVRLKGFKLLEGKQRQLSGTDTIDFLILP